MSNTPVRVRIAPSPTGFFHLGSARTALFNWLFARHHGGSFIVRVEDTDRTRYDAAAVPDLLASLRWLGLDWDEGPDIGGEYGPYYQSERLDLYQRYAAELLEADLAYHCYCSPQRLAAMREEQLRAKRQVGYDRHCRNLTASQRAEYEAQGIVPVVRLKTPLEGRTSFDDVLHGSITVENHTLDDLVLLKSDGYPTYHLGVVVDDHLMRISHIMRGDEWLPSVPKHVLLYRAFDWPMPIFAHLPLILAPTGKGKLSKRHGGVEVHQFRREGYLPEAMVNYLARLGWSYDDKTEIFDRAELVQHFGLAGINNSPARFSYDRLEWMNAYYIRQLPADELAARLAPFMAKAGHDPAPSDLLPIVPLIQERLKTLSEAPTKAGFFFKDRIQVDPQLLIGKKMTAAESLASLLQARDTLAALAGFDVEEIETALRALSERLGLKVGQLLGIIRVAVTGTTVAPPLFESLAVLGRPLTLARLDQALISLRLLTDGPLSV